MLKLKSDIRKYKCGISVVHNDKIMPSISTSGPHENLLDALKALESALAQNNLVAEESVLVQRQQLAHQTLIDGEKGIEPEK